MKNKIIKLFFFLSFVFSISSFAQEKVQVSMTVFEPLPEISFAAFLTNPFLESTPRIMQIIMTPHDVKVIVKGTIEWRKIDETSFNELFYFTTKPFTSRNFYNDDFSSIDGIDIEDSGSDSDLLDENLKKGKPTGTYRINIEVYDENMVFQSSTSEEIDFVNPAQTLSILQPSVGDKLNAGGILVSWTDVQGVQEFIVKANVRTSKFESLEEALQKGNPIVDNKSVGTKTSVNLREILDREIVEGDELVVQVRGIVPGPGGPTIIYSDIVNFYIVHPGRAAVDKGVEDFNTVLSQVVTNLKQQSGGNDKVDELIERIDGLLEKIANGEMSFDDIKITMGDGRRLTYAEFQQILNYLKNNPDLLTNLNFEEK